MLTYRIGFLLFNNSTKLLPSCIKCILEWALGYMQQFQTFMRQWKSRNPVLNRLWINLNGKNFFWDILDFKHDISFWHVIPTFYMGVSFTIHSFWIYFDVIISLYFHSKNKLSLSFVLNFTAQVKKLHHVSLLPALSYYRGIFFQQNMTVVR